MNGVGEGNYSASSSDSVQIESISCFREYEIVQSILLAEAKKTTDPQLKNRLKLLAINAFSKSATISKATAKRLGLQISPFFAGRMIYHRSDENRMLRRLDRAYARALKPPIASKTLPQERPRRRLFVASLFAKP